MSSEGDVNGPADGSPSIVSPDEGNSYYPLNSTQGMIILTIIITCLTIIPLIVRCFMRLSCYSDKHKEEIDKKERDKNKSTWWQDIKHSIRDGLYIELKQRKPILDIVSDIISEQTSQERNVLQPIGPGCSVTEKQIRAFYKDEDIANRIVLTLRLSLGLLASGHCTVDAETTVLRVAESLSIPTPRVSIGHRLLNAQFGESFPSHLLTCERDFVFSTLADLQSFSEMIMCGEIRDVKVALQVCDILLERRLPYGWIIYDICFWLIAPWAAVAAYYGSYWDMLGALCISPFTILTYRLCHRFNITHLEVILVPLVVGIVTPLVWRYVSNGGQDICHVLPQIFGCLLIWLPGAEIVWGTLEIFQGSVVHGASRLVKGLLSAISLGTFLVLGWQIFGRNWATGWIFTTDDQGNLIPLDEQIGAIASLPDSNWCSSPPPYDDSMPGIPSYFSWPLIVGVYNMPLNIFCLMNVYIPLRQCLGPFIVGQVGLLSLAYFQFECTAETCEIPAVAQQAIAAFFATWVAMVVEIIQGLPSAISIIPVLFIFAPGSSSVLSVIGVMHRDAGDTASTNNDSWTSLSMDAFSYGIGIYLGQEIWAGVMRQRYLGRKRRAWNKRNVSESSAGEGSLGESMLPATIREAYHKPQNIHGVGPLTNPKHNFRNSSTSNSTKNEESNPSSMNVGQNQPEIDVSECSYAFSSHL